MAEPVVSFVVERVGDLLIQEAKFLGGVSNQVEQMQTELKRMQRFLQDADKRLDQDETVRGWVSEIRELAYGAENVIETFALEIASRRENGFVKKCKRYATIFIEGAKVYKVGKEIEAIRGRITDLRESLQLYGIKMNNEAEGLSSVWRTQQQLRRTYSHIAEEHPVGIYEGLKILVTKLLDEEREVGHNIVSIIGMGGIGKTTLANKLYHHNDVRRYFDAFAWACISQQFQRRDVWEGILIKLVSPSKERRKEILKMKDDEIAKELYQVQQEKKCLVVLDDIWREEAWDLLKVAFPIGNSIGGGSKIVLTTRNKVVALHVDTTCFLYEPPPLTEDESWELLQKKAFPRRDSPDLRINIDVEKVGRKMLKRCAGLPLAIIVLGGLLATKHSLIEWNKVHENVKLYLTRGKGQDQEYSHVHGVLALSYNELPYHLKPCFLHLGHFPEDYDIPSKTLFRLWVAEGLVPQIQSEVDGTETMEDLAESYLGELIDRFMVQVGEMGSTGRVKTCRLHDLMRDLCLSKANEEKFLEIVRAHNINENLISVRAHRFTVYADDKDVDLKYYARTTYLRSLLFFGTPSVINIQVLSTFRYFKLLKILSIVNCRIGKKMIKEIGCLIHLRYLAFENCFLDHLPSSIGNLRYLQTFIIEDVFWTKSVTVPNVVWKLEQLRHLKLPVDVLLNDKLLKLGNMRKLQTLSGFDTDAFDVAELENFYNLKKLEISLRESEEMEVIPSVCLNRLTSLCIGILYDEKEEKLKSIFSCCHRLQKLHFRGRIDKLPEYQHFPPNLTKLTLRGSNLKEDPMATLEKLPNLVILCLLSTSFDGKLLVCSSNGFPRLKTLVLDSLSDLEEWRVDEEAMPNLCQLCICYCLELKMVPDGIKFITTLRQLEIISMPTTFAERLRVVEGREGDDLYKVRHVPSIIFQGILPPSRYPYLSLLSSLPN